MIVLDCENPGILRQRWCRGMSLIDPLGQVREHLTRVLNWQATAVISPSESECNNPINL